MNWKKAESGEFTAKIGKPMGTLVLRARINHETSPTRCLCMRYRWTLCAASITVETGAGTHGECSRFTEAAEAVRQEAEKWALEILDDVELTGGGERGSD